MEYLIIEYCKYYNNHFVEEVTYRIGDKVKVYNCFSSERGSLYRNPNDFLMGDWEIIDKDGEIYCVYNNVDNRRLWVSKYMLCKATSSWREKLLEAQNILNESSDD